MQKMCFSQYSLILRRTHKGVTSLKFSSHLDQDCKSSGVKRDKKIKNIDICFKLFFERAPISQNFSIMMIFTQVMITTVSGPTFPKKFQVIGTNLGQLWWKLAPDFDQIFTQKWSQIDYY